MNSNLLERRLEMVKTIGLGVSLCETVHSLKAKYGVSKQALYKDWENRETWLSSILSLDDPSKFTLDLISKRRELFRLAAKEYFTGDNTASRVGALRLMDDLLHHEYQMVAPILKNKVLNTAAQAKGEDLKQVLRRYNALFEPGEKVKAVESLRQYSNIIDQLVVKKQEEAWDLQDCTEEERETLREAGRIIMRQQERAKVRAKNQGSESK